MNNDGNSRGGRSNYHKPRGSMAKALNKMTELESAGPGKAKTTKFVDASSLLDELSEEEGAMHETTAPRGKDYGSTRPEVRDFFENVSSSRTGGNDKYEKPLTQQVHERTGEGKPYGGSEAKNEGKGYNADKWRKDNRNNTNDGPAPKGRTEYQKKGGKGKKELPVLEEEKQKGPKVVETKEYKVGVHESRFLNPTSRNPVTSTKFMPSRSFTGPVEPLFVNNYDEYIQESVWGQMVAEGTAFVSEIGIHPHFKNMAFVKISGSADEVIIEGLKDRNRAFDGDEVVFKLKDKNEWKKMEIPVVTLEDAHEELKPENNIWSYYNEGEQGKNAKPEGRGHVVKFQTKLIQTAYVIAISKRNIPKRIPGVLVASSDKFLLTNTATFIPRSRKLPCFTVPNPLAKTGEKSTGGTIYLMEFIRWGISQYLPFGTIVETLGTLQDISAISRAILLSNGFVNYYDFEELAAEQLGGLRGETNPNVENINLNDLSAKLNEQTVADLAAKLEAEDPAIQELAGYTASIEVTQTPNGKTETEIQEKLLTGEIECETNPKNLAEKLFRCTDPSKRRDFRDVLVLTIDPLTARDFDDALSVEILHESTNPEECVYRVGVHIADVTCYVRDGMTTDQRAQENTATVYLQHKCYNMLPGRLSEDLCSLNPQVTRRTYSCVFLADAAGRILSCQGAPNADVADGKNREAEPIWFGRGLIASSARLTYEAAQRILEGEFDTKTRGELLTLDTFGDNTSIEKGKGPEVIKVVKVLWQVAKGFREGHLSKSLDVSAPEIRFDIDPVTLSPKDFKVKPLKEANFLVEEMMIACNQLVARRLCKTFPSFPVLRFHPQPLDIMSFVAKFKTSRFVFSSDSDIDTLINLQDGAVLSSSIRKASKVFKHNVNAISASVNKRFGSNPGDKIQTALSRIVTPRMLSGRDAYNVLSMSFVCGHLSRAKYGCIAKDPESFVHWGIHVPLYMHFTSPIRRYPDDICHRQLTAALDIEFNIKKQKVNNIISQCEEGTLERGEALSQIKRIILNGELEDDIGRCHSLRFENSAKLYGTLPLNQRLSPSLTEAAFERYSEMFGDEEEDNLSKSVLCSYVDGARARGSKQGDIEDELDENTYGRHTLERISRMKGSVNEVIEAADVKEREDNDIRGKGLDTFGVDLDAEKKKSVDIDPTLLKTIERVEKELAEHGLDVSLIDKVLKRSVKQQKAASEAEKVSTDFFMWKYWTGKLNTEGDKLPGFSSFKRDDGSSVMLTVAYVIGSFDRSEISLFSPRLDINFAIPFGLLYCGQIFADSSAQNQSVVAIMAWDIAKGLREAPVGDETTAEDTKKRLEKEGIKPRTKRSILLGIDGGEGNEDDGEEEEEEEEEGETENPEGGEKTREGDRKEEAGGQLFDVKISHFTPIVCEFVLEKEFKLDGMCKLIPFHIQPFLDLVPSKGV